MSPMTNKTEGEGLKPFFCRQGNKYRVIDLILSKIPEHKVYVEPFVGSGAVFFNKPLAEKNVINDLDKETVARFKLLKRAPSDLSKYRTDIDTLDEVKRFFDKHTSSDADRLLAEKIRTCNGFSGTYADKSKHIYKPHNPYNSVKHIDEYQALLRRAVIENKDYESIIRKYDSKDTFFFLDPPYENTSKGFDYAQNIDFDFVRLAEVLKGIKGKFLMTLNDSPNIRRIFDGFVHKGFVAPNVWANDKNKMAKKRKEIFIANYAI